MPFHDFAHEKSNKTNISRNFDLCTSDPKKKAKYIYSITNSPVRTRVKEKHTKSNTKNPAESVCGKRKENVLLGYDEQNPFRGMRAHREQKSRVKESPKRIYEELNARESKQMSTEPKISRERRRCKGGNLGNRVSLVGYINFIRG